MTDPNETAKRADHPYFWAEEPEAEAEPHFPEPEPEAESEAEAG